MEVTNEQIAGPSNEETENVSTETTTEVTETTEANSSEQSTETTTENTENKTDGAETSETTTTVEEENKEQNSNDNTEAPSDFDYSAYEDEFINTGDVSEKSRKDLYKLFPKNLVDAYIDNMKVATAHAIAQTEKKAFDAVGGEQNYKDMTLWMAHNLSKEDIESFDGAVGGSDERIALLAIKGMKAQYDLAQSKKPNIQLGDTNTRVDAGDVFKSRDSYVNAISDKRYESDPDYRGEIEDKLKRTLAKGGFLA